MVQAYTSTGKILGGYWHDEIPIACPLCGPIVYDPVGTGTGQSWLISITASGGGGSGESCLAAVGPNGYAVYGAFAVHGSSVTNMNSVYPALYTATAHTGGGFTFPCPNVADGTYNASNDSGFELEPLTGGAWVNSTSFVPYNAFASMRTQINAVSGHFGFSGTPQGNAANGIVSSTGVCNGANPNPINLVSNWGGNSAYAIGSITKAGDYADVYPAVGDQGYIVSRASLNAVVNNPLWLGWTLRSLYGCGYSPSLPLQALTEGTINYYGVRGVPVPLATCVGTLCTFSSPINKILPNIQPGMSRMYVTGATDVSSPQDTTNNNFVLYNCPTSTTCNVDLAATDQNENCAGNVPFSGSNSGTITTQDSTQVTMTNGMSACNTIANIYPSGETAPNGSGLGGMVLADEMRPASATGAGSASTLLRKRGQTFTFMGTATGTGASWFNANTFRIIPDWLNVTTAPNTNVFYRQLPVLNSTGGTAYIIPNNNYIKGLSASGGPGGTASGSGDIDPDWVFADKFECMVLRCSGERIYQIGNYHSGYSDQYGFTAGNGVIALWGPARFSNTNTYQTTACLHFEDGPCVADGKAHVFGAMYWNRYVKYWQQPRLNAPSIGKPGEIECGAAAGSYGNILACENMTNGPRTITIPLTPYLESGQQIIQQVVDAYGIGPITALSAGTSSTTVTINQAQVVSLVFPVNFAAELQQPTIGARLADVVNASQVVVRFSYDPYYLDTPAGNVYNCGAGTCTPAWDRNIGAIYFRLIYLGASSKVLATSAVQTF
jgi:hypothetical protein